jgi:hypothetical protein
MIKEADTKIEPKPKKEKKGIVKYLKEKITSKTSKKKETGPLEPENSARSTQQ